MLSGKRQILVVDDEANLRRVLCAQLARDGYEVHGAEDGEQAVAFIQEHHVDLVISDLRMPKMGGMELLRWSQAEEPELPIIILTAHATVDTAVEALKIGAVDYIAKPFDQEEVRRLVKKALQVGELSGRDASHPGARGLPEGTRYGIIGTSKAIRDLYAVIDRVAATPTTVLVSGESGTGKELVARALHEHSARAGRPFIKVNCAAIPQSLIESELFGHEKGAFTGALHTKPGRFELAQGGTIFLDEVGEIPLEMQVKLLRVLQEGELERIGGLKTLRVDVRLVAATNRDLRREIEKGRFREDLYYRLNVVPLDLPPLRDRADDIPLLVGFFIDKFNARLQKRVQGILDEALSLLAAYRWPGNVRELENLMERAVLFADGARIAPADLPQELGGAQDACAPASGELGLKEQVRAAAARVEHELISRALKQTGGNVTHAARLLKISRKGLQLKMKDLELRERE